VFKKPSPDACFWTLIKRWQSDQEKWIPYPSLRVKQEEERREKKESEEYRHVVR